MSLDHVDRPHIIYEFARRDYIMDSDGNRRVWPTMGHAQREARMRSRVRYKMQYDEQMKAEVNIDWHNGFAAAFYRIEPVEDECDHTFEYSEGEYGFEDYTCTSCGAWGSTSMRD